MKNLESFIPISIGVWIGISLLVSRVSGWASLAKYYRSSESFQGERVHLQSGAHRWKTSYNNCLTVGMNYYGLYLSVFLILRFGHPNIFIPWADVSAVKKRGLLTPCVEFRFRQTPTIPFRVSERLGRRIVEGAGASWTHENPFDEDPLKK